MSHQAHPVGNTQHPHRPANEAIVSELSKIPGVGPATEQALLSHFKSVKRISQATVDALAEVIGPAKAKVVRAHFTTP